MKIFIKHKNKKIELNVKNCNFFERFFGLMFTKKKNANVLLFDFKKSVKLTLHSLFVFFPFIVIWLDEKNNVVDLRLINSLKLIISSKKPFYKIIEIPLNDEYKDLVESLVGK